MKKKTIIIGIGGGILAITGAIVVPIVVIDNNDNDQKNKEDVEAIIKILNSKSNSQKTLILEGNSTGKIINNNKLKIITKIKELIGFEKLRGVKFDVSLENDVDISTTEKFIIVTVKKEKHSQQLKGENGLKVKRAKNVQEIKIDTIKEYLNNSDNLNLTLPKTNYSTDNEILVAIRKLLATQINNIEINDTNLITKKENSSEVVSVAAHSDEETTPYEITIDDEDFTLKLKQEKFSEDEKIKINIIKTYLENKNNLNFMLPKKTYNADDNILDAIKLKLVNNINDILDGDSHLIIKKEGSTQISSINTYNAPTSTSYKITIGKYDFTLNLKQEEFSEDEKDIKNIKQSLENLTPKELTIDASSGTIKTNKNLILEKLQTLSDYPSDLKGVSISIKEEETEISLEGIAFIIELSKGSVVNQELRGFTVKRSQNQTEIDQNDINEVESLLNDLPSKEVTIDETSGSITTNKNSILEKVQALSDYPSDLKGVAISIKEEETEINLEGITFTIELSKGAVNQELRGFTVKRSQTLIEKIKNNIKEYLKIPINLNIILSKDTDSDYDEDSKILTAIRKKLQILKPFNFSKNDFNNLITKKRNSTELNSIASHIEEATLYEITIDGEHFTLKLKQDQFTEEEKTKINFIKIYLENLNDFNLILPKTSYDDDNNILEAIKRKLIKDIDIITNVDSYLIVKTQYSEEILNVLAHDSPTSTKYEIIIGEHFFTLNLKQDQFTKEENFKKHFNTIGKTLGLQLPKTDYNSDAQILTAIRKKIIKITNGFNFDDGNLITKKERSNEVVSVEVFSSRRPTSYEITFNGENFNLLLKQEQFTNEQKIKNNIIKTYLENRDNLNFVLPKKDYSSSNEILVAIRKLLVTKVTNFENEDSSLIDENNEDEIVSIPEYDENGIEYIIFVGEDEFTLNLKQDQFTKEENFKKHFNTIGKTLGLQLPKTDYNSDAQILAAIRKKIIKITNGFNFDDGNLITKKERSNEVVSVEVFSSRRPTSYEITFNGENFNLLLKQEQFTKEQKIKNNIIQTYLENPDNLNFALPKKDYSNNNEILVAIRKLLVNQITNFENEDSDLIDENNEDEIISIPEYDGGRIEYIIFVGGKNFTLNLNKQQFTEEEWDIKLSVFIIKQYLSTPKNLNILFEKENSYNNDAEILNGIRSFIFKEALLKTTRNQYFLINKKEGSKIVNSISTQDEEATLYEITIDGQHFTLKLNQKN